jgi:hypothetical protein
MYVVYHSRGRMGQGPDQIGCNAVSIIIGLLSRGSIKRDVDRLNCLQFDGRMPSQKGYGLALNHLKFDEPRLIQIWCIFSISINHQQFDELKLSQTGYIDSSNHP